jgi:hypothetical protein
MNQTVPVNTSVWGVGTAYSWSPVTIVAARLLVLALCAVALLLTWRRHRADLDRIPAQLEVAAVGILAQSLLFTFAWDHYLLLLLPLAVFALGQPTAARHWLCVVGFAGSAIALVHVAAPGREAVELRPDNARTCVAMVLMLLGLAVARRVGDREPQRLPRSALR